MEGTARESRTNAIACACACAFTCARTSLTANERTSFLGEDIRGDGSKHSENKKTEITEKNIGSTISPMPSSGFPFRRNRIRTLATLALTTGLWCQMTLSLLCMLPPAVVGAVGGEVLGRIKPPPPPPHPPRTLQSSSRTSTATSTATATATTVSSLSSLSPPSSIGTTTSPNRYKTKSDEDETTTDAIESSSESSSIETTVRIVPPPPPRRISAEESDGDDDGEAIRPPPPPPRRDRAEAGEDSRHRPDPRSRAGDESSEAATPSSREDNGEPTASGRVFPDAKRENEPEDSVEKVRAAPGEETTVARADPAILARSEQQRGQNPPDGYSNQQHQRSSQPMPDRWQPEHQNQRRDQDQRHYEPQSQKPGHYQDSRYYSQQPPGRQQQQQQQQQHQYQQPHHAHGYGYGQQRLLNRNQGSRPLVGESPPSAVTSAFKGLWGKVERTLDDLASLEDTVAGRAQRLVNTAVTTASTASKLSPSRIRSLAQSGAAAAAAATRAKAAHGNVPFRRRAVSRSVSDTTSVPLQPYGQKFRVAIEERERRQKEQATSTSTSTSSSAVYDAENGDKSKSISAKGGATSSSPHHPPSPPSSSPPPPSGESRSAEEMARPAEDEGGNGRRHRYAATGGTERTDSSRSSSWGSRPPVSQSDRGAAGGASSDPGEYGGQQTFAPPSGNGRGPPSRDGSRGLANANANANAGSGMNQRQTRDPSRPTERQPHDHSRNSRIPWDTTASSGKQTPPPSRFAPSKPGPPGYRRRYDGDDDDDDEPAWKRGLKKLVPPLPSLPNVGRFLPGFRRGSGDYSYANMDAWDAAYGEENDGGGGIFGFFKRSKSRPSSPASSSGSLFRSDRNGASDGQPPLIASMLSRWGDGKQNSLLREADVRSCTSIGRNKAVLDLLCMVSIILGFKLLTGLGDVGSFPGSLSEILSATLSKGGSVVSELVEGSWALFAFVYACLFKFMQDKVVDQKIDRLATSVASAVREESEYAQLYLRLVAATPMNRNLPDRLAATSKSQVASVVSKARLNTFVWIVLASLTFMTVSAVGPMLMALSSTFTKIAMLPEWRQWPVQWRNLFGASSILIQNLFHYLESQSTQAFRTFVENPLQFSFHLSMFGSLVLCTLLPRLEERRALTSTLSDDDDLDDDDDPLSSSFESAEEWSRLGTSSASRLSMLSENGSVENALARWRASHAMTPEESSYGSALSSVLRLVAYTFVAAVLAALPVVVSHLLAGETSTISSTLSIFQWDSLFDISFVQLFLFALVYQTLQKVMQSANDASIVKNFQADLVSTKQEIDESNKNADFQFMGSVSPSAGIAVRDLWAAHATKRAWAVRGANLHCKSGEIVAILGEDGNGKTRLLTTLAENLTFPPKRTTTTNKVRGLISVGGLDISKWNRKMLKRRLGIFLSDVRVVADSASLFSGWTMEEILEPIDGVRSANNDSLQRTYTSAEKSAMLLALKLTGLYGSLLTRLPSKTSTIFTANEEDLRPASLKPRSVVLSPGEWSKLILARVLSQTIYDNDNALASNDKVENSLIGSILLLDEPTTMHSEVDEGQLFRDLRLTGAATVITTNKWATGRFADQICVMKNGSIVEMGTHNELLARGPQQSLYAAKWHAMTMQ